jgi:hypothetical protein
LYAKIGDAEQAKNYENELNEILRRLWDKKFEAEIRKGLRS